jgi:rhamnosyltransferase
VIAVPGKTVGIVGARGINNYGGYERMLADLVPRLVREGYDVRCSCEESASGECLTDYEGATLDYFPFKPPANYTLRKVFELLYDSYFVARYSLVCDTIYVLGIYGGLSLLIPRLLKRQVVVNTDGLEWKRAKYTLLERSIIILFFGVSLNLASRIVVDNEQLKRCIGERHRFKTCYIPYGVSEQKPQSWDETKLSSYLREKTASGTITKGKYWLLIARLEPENKIHVIVDGFVKARPKYPLVIVGDFTSDKYRDRVYQGASNGKSPNIFFLGATYDADVLEMLRQHCFAYIHGHSVGGTNPSLLEAMISENLIVCHDNVFNRELCGRFAHYFSNSIGLSDLVTVIETNGGEPTEFRSEVYKRAMAAYSWDRVITAYDSLFRRDDELARTEHETDAHVTQKTEP